MAKSKPRSAPKTTSKKSKGKSKTTLAGKILRFKTFLFLAILIISALSRYVSPVSFWPAAFAGLIFPYLYVFCAVILIIWLIARKRMALYCFIVLLSTGFFFKSFISLGFLNKPGQWDDAAAFKVMSFNVRAFNRYNQAHDENPFEKRNKILTFITDEAPDVLCIQEAYADTTHRYKTTDTLRTIQKASYTHEYYLFTRDKHRFGMATLSRYPIVNKGSVYATDKLNFAIFTDIKKDSDTIRVYNAHFSSIGISKEDFMFIENIGALDFDINDTLPFRHGVRKIAGRLKRAFVSRAGQVQTVAAHMAESPYPVILCTDLNDTPSSYAYRIISEGLQDAFLKSGSGIGKTYNGILPYFRIDYIFCSDAFTTRDFRTHDADLSDHFPVSVLMQMKKNN